MMNRDVMGRQMFANGGVARPRITDPYILETLQKLEVAMGEGNAAVATYVQENFRDLQDIAAVHPQVAPIINRGIAILQSQTAPSLRQPGKSLSDLMTPAPDGSMDYYATGPFGYEEAPEGFTERDMEMFRKDYDRYRENEQGEQRLVPQPPPGVIEEMPSPAPYVPMAMGGVATPRDPYVDPGKRTRVLPAQDFRDPYLDPGKRTQVLPNMSTMLLNNFRQEFKREPQDISELRAYAENLGSGAQARMALGGEPMAAAMGQMGGDPMAGMMGGDPMAAMGAPMPADLGPAGAEGIASQMDPNVVAVMQGMSRNFGDPEQAGSLEEMMDMVRGDTASEEERRTELAEVVGPEDAQQTPDSVLALVQPLMLLMQAEGATETDTGGIGPMAQEAMNVPVSGDMAGGIMQMVAAPPAPEGGVPPVNFNRGGEVRRYEDGKVVFPNYSQENAGAVEKFDVNPAALGPLPMGLSESRFPLQATPELYDSARYIDAAANLPAASPAPVARASSAPDFGQTAAARLAQYKELMGDPGAEEDRNLAQAQFYTDLAKFGFRLMLPGMPGENVFAQAGRAAVETGLGQNTLNLIAKQKAAQRAADRGLKLASITATEAELTAAKRAEAEASGKGEAARIASIDKERDRQLEAAKYSKIVDDIDDKTGITFQAETRLELKNGAWTPVTRRKTREDGTAIIKSIPTDIDPKEIMLGDGRKALYARRKGVPGAQYEPVMINEQYAIMAPAEIVTFGGKAYKKLPNGLEGAPEINVTEYAFNTELNEKGETVNVAVNKYDPAQRIILGTKERPTPQLKQVGRQVVQFTPKQDGTGFTSQAVYTAKAEEQLFTLGNARYSYDPNTKKVTNVQTGETDPVIKVVNNRLVRISDPNDPNAKAEVLANFAGDGKRKVKNFVFGSQALADKFGMGEKNAVVTVNDEGKIYLQRQVQKGGDTVTEEVLLPPGALKGSFFPSDTEVANIREKYKTQERDADLIKAIGRGDGIVRLSADDVEGDAYNKAVPNVIDLKDIKRNPDGSLAKDANGNFITTSVGNGFFGERGEQSLAEAAGEGLGFWSGIRERLSYVASPLGVFEFSQTARGKNTMRRFLILTRDAFVTNPRMPVAELLKVEGIYPNPELLWRNRENEKDKIFDLRASLQKAQERNIDTLRGNFPPEQKALARESIFKVSRVLDMMTGLDAPASKADEATQKLGPPPLKSGVPGGL
jgi:hypothetical protein